MTPGEQALIEVAKLINTRQSNIKMLHDKGWERILDPPLVGNEWIWKHPRWFAQLESKAIEITKSEL